MSRTNRQKRKAYNRKTREVRKKKAIKKYMESLVAKIVTNKSENSDILQQKCVLQESSKQTAEELVEVLGATRNGAGLAAPQIGINDRVVAIRALPKLPITVMIDPKIIDKSDDTLVSPEGCLSYPGHFVDVERHTEIKVSYLNIDGKAIEKKYTGWKARVIQHELDHLDGICKVKDGIDRAESYSMEEAQEKEKAKKQETTHVN